MYIFANILFYLILISKFFIKDFVYSDSISFVRFEIQYFDIFN